MSKQRSLQNFWENTVGGIFVLIGILAMSLVFLIGRLADISVLAALSPPDESVSTPQTAVADEVPPEVNSVVPELGAVPPVEKLDTDNYLPTQGIYAVDGASLDATMNRIDFEMKEKIRLEKERQQRIEAEKRRIAEEKRKAEERRKAEALAKKRAEEKRKAEEARKKAEAEAKAKEEAERKRQAEIQRKADEKRKAEEAKKIAAEKKAEEKRKAEAAKKQAAEEAAKKKAAAEAAAKKKAEEKRKAEEAKKKAEAEAKAKAAKAKAEAERKAREAREAEAKLASLNIGAPSLDGLSSAVPGYGKGDIDAYASTLKSAVQRFYRLPANIPANLKGEFLIKVNAQGKVMDVRVIKSSGYPLFDDEARNAIMAASPLPLPPNPSLRDDVIKEGITFSFKPF